MAGEMSARSLSGLILNLLTAYGQVNAKTLHRA